jgi:hypothetical protein
MQLGFRHTGAPTKLLESQRVVYLEATACDQVERVQADPNPSP